MRVFALFFFVFTIFPVSAESFKIGYINTEMVINNLTLYKQGKNDITKEFESKKQELLDLLNHIELVKDNLSKNNQSLNENELQLELNRIEKLESSFQKETEYWQSQINQKQISLLQKVEIIINNTVKEIALSEAYDLILYENAAYVSDNIDISNKIISKIEGKNL